MQFGLSGQPDNLPAINPGAFPDFESITKMNNSIIDALIKRDETIKVVFMCAFLFSSVAGECIFTCSVSRLNVRSKAKKQKGKIVLYSEWHHYLKNETT